MVVFPNAKINLGLNIIRRRPDGYHDLETGFYPIAWKDVLECSSLPASSVATEPELIVTGQSIQGLPQENICLRAWQVLHNAFPSLPPVHLHLHKCLPMGAGLGGGSADGAFTLRLLCDKFFLSVSEDQLEDFTLELGSDCPFFLRNQPCFAEGRGERMRHLPLDLTAYSLLVVHPGIHVSTALAFEGVRPEIPKVPISEILSQPVETWKGALVNDFERSVFAQYPEIETLKARLYSLGAVYAAMSGSGSSVFGIFLSGQLPKPWASAPDNYIFFRQETMTPTIPK